MILKVIHYYSAPGNVDIGENLQKSIFIIITTSTFFLSNSIVTWEVNRGKLYICEIYSRFNDEAYQKSYVNQILEDDNKIFHDWINCDILVPGNLISDSNKAKVNYLSIKIKSGCIEATECRPVLAEYD